MQFRNQHRNNENLSRQFSTQTISAKERYISLDLLRIILTILVIGNHADSYKYLIDISPIFAYLRNLAVPVFLILSAYLTPNIINSNLSKSHFLSRGWRIYKPVVVWSFVYLTLFYILSSFHILGATNGITQYRNFITFKVITYQLLFGCVVNQPLYYLIDLLWLNISFYILFSYVVKERYHTLLLILLISVSFFLQYSGFNWSIFSTFNDYMQATLGRFIEFVPFFSLGFILRYYTYLSKNRLYSTLLIIVFAVIGYLIWSCDTLKTFGYGGFGVLLGSFSLFFLFAILFVKKTSIYARIIQKLAELTLGVYCIHIIVIGFCSRCFGYLGLTSHEFMPSSLLTIIVVSFLSAYFLRILLSTYGRGIVS